MALAVLTSAAAIGGFVGAFVHAATWHVGSALLPVGLAAALGALAAILAAARQVAGTRLGVSLVAAGWLAPVLALSLRRPEGDIVVAGNLSGLSYVLVGVISIGVALGPALPDSRPARSSPSATRGQVVESSRMRRWPH